MADGVLSPQEFEQALNAGVSPRPPVRIAGASFESLQRFTPTGEVIPLDKQTGVPFTTRLRMSLAYDDETKKDILQQSFATARIENVPHAGVSQFVIRDFRDPETGQVKDLLVDEETVTAKDLADLGDVGVQLFGAYAAMRRGLPMTSQLPMAGRTLAESALASSGAALTAATTEAGSRMTVGKPVKPGELLQQARIDALTGTALDMGLTLPILGGAHLLNMRRGVPMTQEAARATEARNRLAESTGIEVPFTKGQATGSRRLRESEEFLETVTLGGGAFREQRLQQDRLIGNLKNELIRMTGGVPAETLPNKDVVGSRAVSAIRSVMQNAENATATARTAAMTDALSDLDSALNSSTGLASREVLENEAGSAIRGAIQLKHEVLNEIEGDLKARAVALGADAPFVATDPIKKKVASAIKKTYERPGTAGETLSSMPGSLRPILADIDALPSNVTWDDIRNLRHSTNRLINEGQVLGNTDTGVLKQISKALTESIRDGANSLPKEAKEAVLRANKFYAEGIEGFQVKGITDILADPTQKKLGEFAIFRDASGDPDQYFRMKEALTKPLMLEGATASASQEAMGNQAWNVFKQGIWTDLKDQAAKPGNRSLLDPKKLMDRLLAMPKAVREDFLGPQADVAIRSLRRLEMVDNAKIPADEAVQILRQGGDLSPDAIENLAARQGELDKLYENTVVKKFVKGDIGSERIQSGEFLDRFANVGSVSDVKDAMNMMEMADPGLVNVIRAKKVQSIFQDAAVNPLSDDVAARKLAKEIRSPEEQARLEAILGEPNHDDTRTSQTTAAHHNGMGKRREYTNPTHPRLD